MDSFLLDGESTFAACPYARDWLGGQVETRQIRSAANDANRFGGFEEAEE